MHEIVTGSGNVSRLMDEISASTSEQEKGISQITLALSELERVTQSNVAMAEELNGSSDVLRNQVIELQTRRVISGLIRVSVPITDRLTLLPPAARALSLTAPQSLACQAFLLCPECTIPERFQRDGIHSCCLTPDES
jgi:hypothetical protein